ncbi:formiminoglutamate deiminase [Sphingomonas naasensis]|uniref:Formimidoylglutamate deiminase n=1 Tax=Sphingomonas naasensis TaxID=1344951 RepID=A0A4S1W9M1_9SPHN|nr:formimidoylglutamate deiminase [Sphingomonas naasensis]NIJ19388.1 formiminoglutamate deiminase [Sphingomonas naasensis]TGX39133.1 formimidoylglutamate deiminase [Sphingomonas naasensis]
MQGWWFEAALLAEGWAERVRMTVESGRIATLAVDAAPEPGDARAGVALPGVANLHSHAFQRGMAGMAERRGPGADSFWTWRDLMYRFANAIGPDALEAIAALAFVEMLEAGFVRTGEFHYVHHDRDGTPFANPAEMGARLAAAAAETGIGLTLLPVLYMTSGFGGAAPRPEQRRFVHDIDGYAGLIEASRGAVASLADARVGVAPHSLRAVTPEGLAAAVAIAGERPIHIHIAEQTDEVEDCLRHSGQRPVAWLLDHAPVDSRWCLVHATHVTPEELAGIVRSGAVVGLCPITEANLGDGIFPAAALLEAGGSFGVGSDSNVLIDCAQELRSLEYSQRLLQRARNLLSRPDCPSTGRTLFDAARRGGAQALGVAEAELAPGARADFVTLDRAHPTLAGRAGDALLDAFVFANGGGMIDGVWRGGKQWVRGGRHVARDAVVRRYATTLAALGIAAR